MRAARSLVLIVTLHLSSLLFTALLLLPLAGCDTAPAPWVSEARVSAPPPGMQMAAAYFRIENRGATELELRRISSPVFESVEMHETVVEQGISRMRELPKLVLPAGGTANFEPGGRHLMVFGFRQDLATLREVPMELELVSPDGSVARLTATFTLRTAGDP